ncbi:hypothetical protein AAMO2058_000551700 [Amorphochlora amoebiformis]
MSDGLSNMEISQSSLGQYRGRTTGSSFSSARGSGSNWKPTEDQILQYCEFLGMDMEDDSHLKYIAADALTAPIPPPWKEYETPDGYVYYVNTVTGKSSWEHPLDGFYKQMYLDAKNMESGENKKANLTTVDAQQIAAKDREIDDLKKTVARLTEKSEEGRRRAEELKKRIKDLTSSHEQQVGSLVKEHKSQMETLQSQQKAIKSQIEELNKNAQESHMKSQSLLTMQENDKQKILSMEQKVMELSEQNGKLKVEAIEAQNLREKFESNEILLKQAQSKAEDGMGELKQKLETREREIAELQETKIQLNDALRDEKKSREAADVQMKLATDENKTLTLEVEEERLKVQTLEETATSERKRLERLDQRFQAKEKEVQELKGKVEEQTKKLAQAEEEKQAASHKVDVLDKITSKGLHEDHAKCIEELKTVAIRCEELKTEVKTLNRQLTGVKSNLLALQSTVSKIESERREALNKLQDLQGNIRVMCRLRPMLSRERRSSISSLSMIDKHITCTPSTGGVDIIESKKEHNFAFNHVFERASQTEVFNEVSNLVQSALDGYNVCLFAYGQTGSGKTFTMVGGDGNSKGIIPRAVEKILDVAERKSVQGWEFKIEGSFLEIYNEQVRDLLIPDSPNLEIKIQPSKKPGVVFTHVPGLSKKGIKTMHDMTDLMDTAAQNRSVAATDMNLHSSRSHSVFTLYMTGRNEAQGLMTKSALYLCDLAGSERVDKSGVSGDRLKEAVMINKSLSALSDVFQALARGDNHVPFRNSKLTYLLQCCFVGSGKTLMFVNLSPNPNSANESLCSLRFAQRVNTCVMGPAEKQMARVRKPPLSKMSGNGKRPSSSRGKTRPQARPPPGSVPKYARKGRGVRKTTLKK